MKGADMLKINMEYRKGILFIRLKGELTENTYKSLNNYLIPIINNQGLKYIVYNLSSISLIDEYGKQSLEAGIRAVNKNNGMGLICKSNITFNKNIKIVDDELKALKIINI